MDAVLDSKMFIKLLKSGVNNLDNNKKIINDLNVFPIPDGDTGDNMLMTIKAGLNAVLNMENENVSSMFKTFASNSLLGARGNSGVILSRIIAGIAKGFENTDVASIEDLKRALESGVKEAYASVVVPVEGTILTVFRVPVMDLKDKEYTDFKCYFSDLYSKMKIALDETPEQLEVLKEAGVVDSGGAGLLCIFEGILSSINGRDIKTASSDITPMTHSIDISTFTKDSILEFGYCTEFLLRLQSSKVDVDNFDINTLISYLEEVGESVVCFKDDSIVKVHVHTMNPGTILNHVQEYGEFLTLKIENMMLQHNEATIQNNFSKPKAKKKKYGIVTCAFGEGIKNSFLELGVDYVIDGGQSMNPSSADFIEAFKNTNAENILVFPNNSNIVMAASQAAELYDEANVIVIKCKTIGAGYAAISNIDLTIDDTNELLESINEIMEATLTGMVSIASRDTESNGIKISKGDYIGFVDDTIYNANLTPEEALLNLAEKVEAKNYDIMILLTGKDAKEEEIEKVVSTLSKTYRRTEIIPIAGGQPIYNYIMILE